jgi:hypothetical protein
MRNTILTVGLAMLLVAAGCGSSGDAPAEQAQQKKSVDTGESKWLEEPQEALKGDVVTYEIEGQIATRAKFEILFSRLEVPREPIKQVPGEFIRDCPPIAEGPDKGKPAPEDCKIKVPTLDTYYMAKDKQNGQAYDYRAQRARYPDQNILRHFLDKK